MRDFVLVPAPTTAEVKSALASSSDAPSARPSAVAGASATSHSRFDDEAKAAAMENLAGIQPGEEREMAHGDFMKLFRVQATDPIGDGWQRARSTAGGVSVEMPLPFNDAVMRAKAEMA